MQHAYALFDAKLRISEKYLFIITLSPGRGESVETAGAQRRKSLILLCGGGGFGTVGTFLPLVLQVHVKGYDQTDGNHQGKKDN